MPTLIHLPSLYLRENKRRGRRAGWEMEGRRKKKKEGGKKKRALASSFLSSSSEKKKQKGRERDALRGEKRKEEGPVSFCCLRFLKGKRTA